MSGYSQCKKLLFCGDVSHFWKVIVTLDSFMLCILFYFLCCDSQWSVSLKGGFLTSYPEKVPPMFYVFLTQLSSISIHALSKSHEELHPELSVHSDLRDNPAN